MSSDIPHILSSLAMFADEGGDFDQDYAADCARAFIAEISEEELNLFRIDWFADVVM
jgi:hypothetical protein